MKMAQMKYSRTIIFTLLMGIIIGFVPRHASRNLSELQWLLGEWQMQKKNGTLIESWHQKDE